MDPLSALSIAACVVQFVDFGTKVLKDGKELYNSADGALAENVDFATSSSRLQQLSTTLQDSLHQGTQGLQQGPLQERDAALENICYACMQISKELVSKLENLKVQDGSKHRKWESLKQILKSMWSKKEIEDMADRLAKLRVELDTHVLISLR